MGKNGNFGEKCLLLVVKGINAGRRQGAGGRRNKDKKKEEEVRKSKEISFSGAFAYLALLFGIYSTFPCTSTTLPVL